MRRTIWLALLAVFAVTALTACMSDDNKSSRAERRAAALVNAGGNAGGYQRLTIDGITPQGKVIEVLTYSWGVEQAERAPQIANIQFKKTMDATSPLLFEGAATRGRYPTAELKLYLPNVNGQLVDYLTYTLENVQVKSVQPSIEVSGAATKHVEQVSLSFATINQVVNQDAQGNVGPVEFGWDLVNGVRLG